MHAFVSGAGTGGTIAGVSVYLKSKDPSMKIYLIDPPGSSLYNKVWLNCLFACLPARWAPDRLTGCLPVPSRVHALPACLPLMFVICWIDL